MTMTATNTLAANEPAIDETTRKRFKAHVAAQGLTITGWARARQFAGQSVSRVLNGYDVAVRGKAAEIADAIKSEVAAHDPGKVKCIVVNTKH